MHSLLWGAWQNGRGSGESRRVKLESVYIFILFLLLCVFVEILFVNSKMWLFHNVCEVVGIFVAVCVGLAVTAEETMDLSKGSLVLSCPTVRQL